MGDVVPLRPSSGPSTGTSSRPAFLPTTRPAAAPAVDPLWREVAGEVLRAARHRREQTLADVATRAGVSVAYLSEIERGVKEPSSEVLAAVTGALDLTLAELTAAVLGRLTPLDLVADRHGPPDARPTGPVALAA